MYEGEISGPCLGVDAHAFDADGHEVIGELGELVIAKPMPSMPVGLWNDPDGERYRASYFDRYPGRVAPGRLDQVHRARELRDHRPLGRDAEPRRGAARHRRVLRRGRGVRRDRSTRSSCTSRTPAGGIGELLLFVVPAPGAERRRGAAPADRRRAAARSSRRATCPTRSSPFPAIPRTLTGKKLEAPVKRILRGEPADRVASRDSLADPGGARCVRGPGQGAGRGPAVRRGSIYHRGLVRAALGPSGREIAQWLWLRHRDGAEPVHRASPSAGEVSGGSVAQRLEPGPEILAETHLAFEVTQTYRTPRRVPRAP